MLIIMKKNVAENELRSVKEYLVNRDFDFHQSTGANRVIIGIIGDATQITAEELKSLPGVLEVFRIPNED